MNILEVDPKFQQPTRKTYVFHSRYSMEQDFLDFITNNPNDMDWDYLPIFWAHWNLTHDYAKTGREELQEEVNKVVKRPEKTFTICQYDDGPQVDIGNVTVFNAAKRTETGGITIPILGGKIPEPEERPEKEYLSCFVGNYKTDPIRVEMAKEVGKRGDIYISHSKKNLDLFTDTLLKSYSALCPRGSSIGSFRFYEAMQLGVTPIAIGDVDPRPFKGSIYWDSCSFYLDDVKKLNDFLNILDKQILLEMGKQARKVWEEQIWNQNWCRLVLKELKWMR